MQDTLAKFVRFVIHKGITLSDIFNILRDNNIIGGSHSTHLSDIVTVPLDIALEIRKLNV